MSSLFTHRDATRDVEVAPESKISLDRYRTDLAKRAEDRQQSCWMRDATGCAGRPVTHVQEVGFDLRDLSAKQHVAMISSEDLGGPVPGFCLACLASEPARLAEAVYSMRPEIQFGFKPHRWFVRFTDGSRQVGACQTFALHAGHFSYSDRATT